MQNQELRAMIETVEGWLTDEEGELLYGLAQKCSGRGVIVEIGSWRGKSTICLGKGSQNGKRVIVYAIDPHTGAPEHKALFGKVWTFDEFKANIRRAQVDDVVSPIVKPSAEAAQDFQHPVEFVFIDGAHEYEAVKLDFDVWFPKVIEGGIMAFHDSTRSEGVGKVVDNLVCKSKHFKDVGLVHSITYARKVGVNSAWDRMRNRYILFLKNVYEMTTTIRLPKPLRRIGKHLLRQIQ